MNSDTVEYGQPLYEDAYSRLTSALNQFIQDNAISDSAKATLPAIERQLENDETRLNLAEVRQTRERLSRIANHPMNREMPGYNYTPLPTAHHITLASSLDGILATRSVSEEDQAVAHNIEHELNEIERELHSRAEMQYYYPG